MPGVQGAADRRPHACTTRSCVIESGGRTAVFVGRPDADDGARAAMPWIMGYDLYPDGHAGVQAARSSQEAVEHETLVFFEHDPAVAAGYLRDEREMSWSGV